MGKINSGYEWKTKAGIFGMPFIHIAVGRDSETGKLLVAKGVIAIGQFALGIVAIGQFAMGLFTVAQFALGFIFGMGQFATGLTAIAQFAIGKYALCQIGYGQHVYSSLVKSAEALEYFKHFI